MVEMKGGTLSRKPDAFYAENEEREELSSLMFIPENLERGQYVYYSGLLKKGKNGFQIMRAKKGNSDIWIDMEPVNDLNTEYNEILPYFDPVGKDIYFASDRSDGTGGFDIYQSHYDEDRDKWSTPANLGFPVNSVYDDYLLLPGTDLGMMMFFSARDCIKDLVTVYRVHFSEPKVSSASASPEELRRIANLDYVAADALMDMAEYSNETGLQGIAVKESKKETTMEESLAIPDSQERYQKLVAQALEHQSTADSLTELSTTAKRKVRESENPNDRWLYQKQIVVWEKKAEKEQLEADKLYAVVAKYKSDELPEDIDINKPAEDITVSQYASTEAEQSEQLPNKKAVSETEKKSDVTSPADQKVKTLKKEVQKEPVEISKEFTIASSSPYSDEHPIPVDIQLPDGVIYRIQLAAFSKHIPPNYFGGISPMSAENVVERNITRYFVGMFSHYNDATKALERLRSAGYNDAFIIGWYNGTRMATNKVRNLE